jgi:hypothetical protein
VTAEATFAVDEAMSVGRQRALNKARSAALAKAGVPIDVKQATLIVEGESGGIGSQLAAGFDFTAMRAVIVAEDILADGPVRQAKDGSYRYPLRLRARIGVPPARKGGGVRLNATLDRAAYNEGDAVVVSIETNRDVYLYAFNTAEDHSSVMLVPNGWDGRVKLSAGGKTVLPTPAMRDAGVDLIAMLPPGRRMTSETITVIAASKPIDAFIDAQDDAAMLVVEANGGSSLARNVWLELLQRDPDEWATAVLPLRIRARPGGG